MHSKIMDSIEAAKRILNKEQGSMNIDRNDEVIARQSRRYGTMKRERCYYGEWSIVN